MEKIKDINDSQKHHNAGYDKIVRFARITLLCWFISQIVIVIPSTLQKKTRRQCNRTSEVEIFGSLISERSLSYGIVPLFIVARYK